MRFESIRRWWPRMVAGGLSGVLALAGLTVLALAGLTVPAPASAAPAGYQVVFTDHNVAPFGGFVRATAVCPAGLVVLGGGAQVVGSGTGFFGTVIRESAPGTAGGQSLWLAAVGNYGSLARTVRISAVCASQPVGYQVVATDHNVAGGGFVRTGRLCPAGRVVLGGGTGVVGAGSGNFGTVIRESAPGTVVGRSLWMAAVSNYGSLARTVRISAVCASQPAGYQVVSTDHNLAGGYGFVRTITICPPGLVVVGGGTKVIGAGSENFQMITWESHPTALSGQGLWLAAVTNAGPVARTLRINAVCVS